MTKNKYKLLAGILLGVFAANSCYYDKKQLLYPAAYSCSGVPSSFAKDVLPLIQTSCDQGSGCHGAGSGNGPGPLTTYTQVQNAGAQILNSVQAGRMPLGSKLSPAQLQVITCWSGNGMLNN